MSTFEDIHVTTTTLPSQLSPLNHHISKDMPGKTRPIEKFAAATAKCTTPGAVYGKCVAANYQNVSKDMCAKEFMALKDCYLVSLD